MSDKDIIKESFEGLYPGRSYTYDSEIRYNNRLKDYRGRISFDRTTISITLNSRWEDVDPDIKKGIIQYLLIKIFGGKKQTLNMEFYDTFIKKLHLVVEKTESDPLLEDSFDRVNETYFYGTIGPTNLRFGRESMRTLGSYSYTTDTITISNVFRDGPQEYIDYIMYHEMLHKKMKFKTTNSRSLHHSAEFKRKEKEFEGAQRLENEISDYVRAKRRSHVSYHRPKRKARFFRWF